MKQTKIESFSVEVATADSTGLISAVGHFPDGRKFKIDYTFPDNGNLFSPEGDSMFDMSVDGKVVASRTDGLPEWLRETEEKFRCLLGKFVSEVNIKVLGKAVRVFEVMRYE